MSKNKNQPRSGPRSNFSFLPPDIRYKVAVKLYNGETLESICHDPELVQAYELRGMSLNKSGLSRVRQSPEYHDIAEALTRQFRAVASDRLVQAVIAETGSDALLADRARVELLRTITESISDSPGEFTPADIARLTRATVDLSNKSAAEKILRLESENAKLRSYIEKLTTTDKDRAGGISKETLEKIERELKLL